MAGELQAAFENDPAAPNYFEVLLCYPGVHAIFLHRIAHRLYAWGVPKVIPRVLSQINRFLTGVEIHPGAKIGDRVFIDHGMGVVIGETSEVGDDVTMFQGVVLGGTGKIKEKKRHPTVGNNVVIGAGAIVLGPVRIGNDVKIGAGSVVLRDIPDDSTAVGVPALVVRHKGKMVADLEHGDIDNPVQDKLTFLEHRIRMLEKKVSATSGTSGQHSEG